MGAGRQPPNESAVEIRQTRVVEQYSGPIPPPDTMERYEALVPGAADRILRMAEREAEHGHALQRTTLGADIEARCEALAIERRGQLFALAVVVLSLGATVALALTGHEVPAAAVGGATLVSLATAFLGTRRRAEPLRPGSAEQARPPR